MPYVNRLYLTFVEGEFQGTAFFPAEVPTPAGFAWHEVTRESHPVDERHRHPHHFVEIELVRNANATSGPLAVLSLWRL